MPELSRFAGNPCDGARVIKAKPLYAKPSQSMNLGT